jgi:hypothetical protein
METIYIKSEHLQLAEPLMIQYYDYDSSMLLDEIRSYIENSGLNYVKIIDGVPTVDFEETFKEHKELIFGVKTPYKETINEAFEQYFTIQDDDEDEVITDDDIVLLCLTFMSYIYYKEKEKLFNNSFIITDLDLEYQCTLHNSIYPEMLSLYRMILESKTKKNRGAKVSITYKQDKIDVNTAAWFLDDMEAYFKDRFPHLTLDEINRILPSAKGKAGRKFSNRITNNIIWGTYQLLYNHHSKFKNSNTRVSEEICTFIINYLDYLSVPHDLILVNIRDWLKDMIKRNYIPQWDLAWRNVFSNIKEKEPENLIDKINQPSRKYNLSNL